MTSGVPNYSNLRVLRAHQLNLHCLAARGSITQILFEEIGELCLSGDLTIAEVLKECIEERINRKMRSVARVTE